MRFSTLCVSALLSAHIGAHADGAPRFNISMLSYRTCSSVLPHPTTVRSQAPGLQGPYQGPYLVPEQRLCGNDPITPRTHHESTIDTTAWLKLGGERTGLRMVGLGFKMSVDRDTHAQVRLRRGGLHVAFAATF